MNIRFEGSHKSITSFEWLDIPKLAIITGVNGVGKSQFLEMLFEYTQNPNLLNNYKSTDKNKILLIDGLNLLPHEVGFWESRGGNFINSTEKFNFYDLKDISDEIYKKINPLGVDNLGKLLNNQGIQQYNPLTSRIKNPIINNAINRNIDKITQSIEESSGKNRISLMPDDIIINLPEDILFEGIDVINSDCIEFIFYLYQVKKELGLINGKPQTHFSDPPWKILNEVLLSSGLPYVVNEPPIENINHCIKNSFNSIASAPYSAKLINNNTLNEIGFSNLSSGEKVILSLAFLLYYSEKRDFRRKLLLLDEPDAHLHPSMTKQFFDVIFKTFVMKYDIRVIITTHSPSTLALASKTSDCGVYEMKKEPKTQFIKDESFNYSNSISILTNGLITVNPYSKYIFVEDEDDVNFYSNINSLVEINRNLIFIPASNRLETEKGKLDAQGGGKHAVANWTKRFEKFSNIISGLIDKDNGNESLNEELKIINRYSIENYLADPIIIFCVLNRSSSGLVNQKVSQFSIQKGREHLLHSMTQIELQEIADTIISLIQSEILEDSRNHLRKQNYEDALIEEKIKMYSEKVDIKFSNGIVLSYPKWLIEHRGKNIFRIIEKQGIQHLKINDLIPLLNCINMIPSELINKIKECL